MMKMNDSVIPVSRLRKSYFQNTNTVMTAERLIGKTLVRDFGAGRILRSKITETEAYVGKTDKACHASKGMTPRTEIMFGKGGFVYVYLIYGMYWMLNFVTSVEGTPEAILIRGLEDCSGPGRIGRLLELDKSFYGEDLETSSRIWLEDSDLEGNIIKTPRIGIDYAGEPWVSKPWRFLLEK